MKSNGLRADPWCSSTAIVNDDVVPCTVHTLAVAPSYLSWTIFTMYRFSHNFSKLPKETFVVPCRTPPPDQEMQNVLHGLFFPWYFSITRRAMKMASVVDFSGAEPNWSDVMSTTALNRMPPRRS
ncbi:hypothetical protein Y032_0129g1496 [Ancylostoma ceylanicum]|uniref:Uncharacterized protein n=1 Tax=Ancylostoma ceylanicum TaxID=53326 RepID=A0A016T7U7_9BILA|nr:hypothetical protein Y032_0129g1496 [Ancylostoma ceylanicum]